jgi:nucleoside-diphosphate-sugar epimerase
MNVTVSGADAVVSALGPSTGRRATGLPLVDGTRHILGAMRRHGVARYIGHATPSVLDPRETPTPVTRLISLMPRTLMPRAYDEIRGMTDPVKASDLDWTIVRFIRPTNGPRRGRVRAGFFGTDRPRFSIARADIAAFTAAQVDDDTYLRRAPAISSGRGGSTGPA